MLISNLFYCLYSSFSFRQSCFCWKKKKKKTFQIAKNHTLVTRNRAGIVGLLWVFGTVSKNCKEYVTQNCVIIYILLQNLSRNVWGAIWHNGRQVSHTLLQLNSLVCQQRMNTEWHVRRHIVSIKVDFHVNGSASKGEI